MNEDSSDNENVILLSLSSLFSSDDSLFTSGLLEATNDADLSSLSDIACLKEYLNRLITNKSMSSHDIAQALIALVFYHDFLDRYFLWMCESS